MFMNSRHLVKRYLSTRLAQNVAENVKVKQINKLLIANRGEIACRVVRTAKRLGLRTVAVYSDADVKSLHVEMADEAFNIGPAASQKSYLRGDQIIQVAKDSGCQAIHPGYGFLSESVEFAELCQRENILFMGPPASAIRDMGIKSTSKHIMSAAGVPVINGYHGEDQSDETLIEEANKIGFPLMIKAVRGGGGKGMRIAETEKGFLEALNSARTESDKAFGDSSMLLERYVRSPRHVEVQVFADQHGNAVSLYERDCSVQRRHQKIIEEAPAPGISDELRAQLGMAAVRAAKAVGYVGAGTVEFILDKEDLTFHFMEMNTRLQVEHPITEMITGTDLVEWQIRVAAGEPLPFTQEEIQRKGHAFEARIYAEDPRGGFLPGAGPLEHLTTPNPTEKIRVETGVRQGDEVSVHYDPMIAKLVVWGENRTQALNSLIVQLADYHISGLQTNINFLIDLAKHPSFQSGDVHTGFIDQHFDSLFPIQTISETIIVQAAISIVLNERNASIINFGRSGRKAPFFNEDNFRVNYQKKREIKLKCNDKVHVVTIKVEEDGYSAKVDENGWRSIKTSNVGQSKRFTLRTNIDGVFSSFSAVISPNNIAVFNETGKTDIQIIQPMFLSTLNHVSANDSSSVISPMPGILDRLSVKTGDVVKAGDPIAVIIAMKMEHVLKAPRDGIIKSVNGEAGKNVAKGAAIVYFVEEDTRE